jgi:hypothetical protein
MNLKRMHSNSSRDLIQAKVNRAKRDFLAIGALSDSARNSLINLKISKFRFNYDKISGMILSGEFEN